MNRAESTRDDRPWPGVTPEAEGPVLSWSAGVIRLRDAHLIDPRTVVTLLQRIFRLDEVRSVEIDRSGGMATISYASEVLCVAEALARMAGALAREPGRGEGLPDVPPALLDGDVTPFRIFRHGTLLSTWAVAHELAGRVRFRHEGLRGNAALARRVERELATVHGVVDAQASPLTAGLLVHFDAAATSTRQLLQVLDGLSHEPAAAAAAEGHAHPPVRFALANASVGLAAVGEFAVPALLPASAVLLLASNLKTFGEAGRQLRRRQLGLPVLSTFIVVATLSTGQFLAAALMSWTIKFWHRRYRARVIETRRRLLSELTQHRRFARVCAGGTWVEVPIETLRSGDVIAVEEHELVAADGRVVVGEAMVDERPIRGGRGLARKGPGDAIFAGSWVVAGVVHVEISVHGTGTRAAALGRALWAASATAPASFAVTSHGEAFAGHAVGPTLAVAGLGLLVGDTTTAAAILRPDYATGPGMGVALRRLHDLAGAARGGVLVRDVAAFRRFAEVDTIVFDDHPALRRAGLQIARVQACGAADVDTVLRYAATAYRELADERARALLADCAARGILPLDLDLPPRYLGPHIDLVHESVTIHVREAFGIDSLGDAPEDCNHRGEVHAPEPGTPAPLLVSAGGRVIGMVLFERSARPEAAAIFQELRDAGALTVGLVSARPGSELGSLASALGADFHQAGLSADARAAGLRSCAARGMKVAYVGDCRRNPGVARAAHVALSRFDEADLEDDPAPILLLGPDLAAIAGLRELSRSHVSRTHAIHGSILIPNLVCIAGAFLLGFTSLYSVLLTNLGTLSIDFHVRDRPNLPDGHPSRRGRAVRNGSGPAEHGTIPGSHRPVKPLGSIVARVSHRG